MHLLLRGMAGMLHNTLLHAPLAHNACCTQALPPAARPPRRAMRVQVLIRAPALLGDGDDSSYDDLLALDQFNVRRAVRPLVLASLPRRAACEHDLQQQRLCLICLESWAPPVAAATAAAATAAAEAPQAPPAGPLAAAAQQQRSLLFACWSGPARPRAPAAAAVTEAVDAEVHDSSAGDSPGSSASRQSGEGTGSPEPAPPPPSPAAPDAAAAGAAGALDVAARSGTCACGSPCCGTAKRAMHPAAKLLVMRLPCGHEFCSSCITTWLLEHATCPVCRWAFPEQHTRLINLHK